MSKAKSVKIEESPEELFDRIVSILEEARGNVVRAVNSNMVLAYWLIGREIVQELQGGEDRAAYGKKIIADLSKRLTQRYGGGFSPENIQLFRRLYLVYSERIKISYPAGTKSSNLALPLLERSESTDAKILSLTGREFQAPAISSLTGREFKSPHGFSKQEAIEIDLFVAKRLDDCSRGFQPPDWVKMKLPSRSDWMTCVRRSSSVTASLSRRQTLSRIHRGLKPPATLMPSLRDERRTSGGTPGLPGSLDLRRTQTLALHQERQLIESRLVNDKFPLFPLNSRFDF